jgi:hypothetical protein
MDPADPKKWYQRIANAVPLALGDREQTQPLDNPSRSAKRRQEVIEIKEGHYSKTVMNPTKDVLIVYYTFDVTKNIL